LTRSGQARSAVLSSYAQQAVCKAICRGAGQAMPGTTAIAGNIELSPEAVGVASLPFSSQFMVLRRRRRT